MPDMPHALVTLPSDPALRTARFKELFPPTSRPGMSYKLFDRLTCDEDRYAFGHYLVTECGFDGEDIGLSVRLGVRRAKGNLDRRADRRASDSRRSRHRR